MSISLVCRSIVLDQRYRATRRNRGVTMASDPLEVGDCLDASCGRLNFGRIESMEKQKMTSRNSLEEEI